jgi:hypothetical protein
MWKVRGDDQSRTDCAFGVVLYDCKIQPEAGRALADPIRNTGDHDHVQVV